jgi:hypothetical protein
MLWFLPGFRIYRAVGRSRRPQRHLCSDKISLADSTSGSRFESEMVQKEMQLASVSRHYGLVSVSHSFISPLKLTLSYAQWRLSNNWIFFINENDVASTKEGAKNCIGAISFSWGQLESLRRSFRQREITILVLIFVVVYVVLLSPTGAWRLRVVYPQTTWSGHSGWVPWMINGDRPHNVQ